MNAVRTLALGAVGALLLTVGADARSASVVVTPRHGTPRTHFVVSFPATRALGNGGRTSERFEVKASGPTGRRCASSVTVSVAPASHRQMVSVTLRPPTRFDAWCRGGYAGTVSQTVRPQCSPGEVCPMFIVLMSVGRFEFGVN